ncbi:MAG TPA: alpha/beta hydrolase [Cytophagales bacterium]|nr:alpha/beta hydrolase [Cytophagales bacterium]HAA22803.1 alpha/beta hydrolase [Cytophagales bacterium]HAP65322.1 alpha/beta hydrolase [Cytophagales bacterium]
MGEHEIKPVSFSYEGRYIQLGELNDQTQELWIVCHGYGQLANYFANHFRVLESPTRCIIAPEGLNRFYLQGFSGRVGATWMTKEDRLVDIQNYLNYLEAIFHQVTKGMEVSRLKINVLGFSQGAATVSRWVTQSDIDFNRLILWAGIFPPDLNIPRSKKKLGSIRVDFVYGDEDPFLSKSDRVAEQRSIARMLGVEPTITQFHGEHVIDRDTLLGMV